MVQPPRGSGLALEAADLLGTQLPGRDQQLEGDPAAERLLIGLVHEAHPSAADLAEQPEVAQPLRRHAIREAGRDQAQGFVEDAGGRPDGLDQGQWGKARPYPFGQAGMACRVFFDGGKLAPAPAFEELLRQRFDRVRLGAGSCSWPVSRPDPRCQGVDTPAPADVFSLVSPLLSSVGSPRTSLDDPVGESVAPFVTIGDRSVDNDENSLFFRLSLARPTC